LWGRSAGALCIGAGDRGTGGAAVRAGPAPRPCPAPVGRSARSSACCGRWLDVDPVALSRRGGGALSAACTDVSQRRIFALGPAAAAGDHRQCADRRGAGGAGLSLQCWGRGAGAVGGGAVDPDAGGIGAVVACAGRRVGAVLSHRQAGGLAGGVLAAGSHLWPAAAVASAPLADRAAGGAVDATGRGGSGRMGHAQAGHCPVGIFHHARRCGGLLCGAAGCFASRPASNRSLAR
ncbi:MAG: hypothetical protein RIQ99_259, partial [Pseudomonadota bacterium]